MAESKHLFDQIKMGDDMLSMEHITKIYENGFIANSDVNFCVRKGEIHGLVGENGAGKTTLMKVLFGQESLEEGKILLAGQETKITSPLDALEYGIGMVHQHFMLVESLSVADNMVLGGEPVQGVLYDRKEARHQTLEVAEKYELAVDPDAIVENLSVGYKQRVEILKILLRGARLLLLDEPTAVLTPQEIRELFVQLKKLRDQGFSIVFISHKLNQVREICDRITVLRMGKSMGTVDVADVTETDISRMMVGRDVILDIEKKPAKPGASVLKVRDLTYVRPSGKAAFEQISFDVQGGIDVIAGLLPIGSGNVWVNQESIKGKKSIREIREMGVSMVGRNVYVYGLFALLYDGYDGRTGIYRHCRPELRNGKSGINNDVCSHLWCRNGNRQYGSVLPPAFPVCGDGTLSAYFGRFDPDGHTDEEKDIWQQSGIMPKKQGNTRGRSKLLELKGRI